MELTVKHKVPVVITSQKPKEVYDAVQLRGIAFHDIINNFFARKAIEKVLMD